MNTGDTTELCLESEISRTYRS